MHRVLCLQVDSMRDVVVRGEVGRFKENGDRAWCSNSIHVAELQIVRVQLLFRFTPRKDVEVEFVCAGAAFCRKQFFVVQC